MCALGERRFNKESDRDVYGNAVNSCNELDQLYCKAYENWQRLNPEGTQENFNKDATPVSCNVRGKEVSISPLELMKRLEAAENVVKVTGAKGHWSLAAVGMLGGLLFGGASLVFAFFGLPALLLVLPELGCVAVFFAASSWAVPGCAVGAFLIGMLICGGIHRAIYPYACESPQLPEDEIPPEQPEELPEAEIPPESHEEGPKNDQDGAADGDKSD